MAFGHTPPRRDANPAVVKDNAGNVIRQAFVFRDASNTEVVTIEVPTGIDVTPAALDWKAQFDTAPGAPQYKIINLVLQDKGGKVVKNFATPFVIRIKQLSGYARVKYYDPTQNRWVDFGATPAGGEFVINRNAWFDDPGIGIDPT